MASEFPPPANVRLRKGTAGVSPASSRGVSPRVGTGGETPPELAGEDACATPPLARPLTDHGTGTLAPCCAVATLGFSSRPRLHFRTGSHNHDPPASSPSAMPSLNISSGLRPNKKAASF